jgi:sulfofructose kinase
MSDAPAVVGGGAVAVDQLVFVDSSIGDGKGRILRTERRFGGNIATALVAAARTGVRCAFLGHLPDDATEPDLLGLLRDEGVDTSRARLSPSARPIRSTILVDQDGERFIAFDDDTVLGLPDDLDLDLVRSARVLLVDDYNPSGSVRAAVAARDAGVSVVADFERGADRQAGRLFDLTDHLILPHDFALAWTGTDSPTEAIEALWSPERSAVVVTVGAEGSWYRARGSGSDVRAQHCPAPSVEVVDTTGCGDVFHGVYAASLADGATVERCVVAATVAAAECATHPGGIAPRPHSS